MTSPLCGVWAGWSKDRNGDSFADFVNARLVTGAKPLAGEIGAAADLTARLGLETTDMNLPLDRSTRGAGLAIVVGPGGAVAASRSTTDSSTADLKPGEGRVRLTADHPGTLFLGGATETGTMAAAEYVAARLPHAWDVKGPKLDRIVTEIREVLKPPGAVVTSILIPEAIVTTAGMNRLAAHVELASPETRAVPWSCTARVARVEVPMDVNAPRGLSAESPRVRLMLPRSSAVATVAQVRAVATGGQNWRTHEENHARRRRSPRGRSSQRC